MVAGVAAEVVPVAVEAVEVDRTPIIMVPWSGQEYHFACPQVGKGYTMVVTDQMVVTNRGDGVIGDFSRLPKPGGGPREFITVHRQLMDSAGLKLVEKGAATAADIGAFVCAGAIHYRDS